MPSISLPQSSHPDCSSPCTSPNNPAYVSSSGGGATGGLSSSLRGGHCFPTNATAQGRRERRPSDCETDEHNSNDTGRAGW